MESRELAKIAYNALDEKRELIFQLLIFQKFQL